MMSFTKQLKDQRGNALFLILIAVALFAALSYAVTQSGRGGGNVDREQNLITASQLTQYPALLRTTVTRMVLTGTTPTNLLFDSTPGTTDAEVFGAAGGGATYQLPPSAVATQWGFLGDAGATGYYILGIGLDTANGGEDVIAYLDAIPANICQQLRRGLGLPATPIPSETTTTVLTPAAPGSGGSGANAWTFDAESVVGTAQSFSCVDNGGTNLYFHALVEQ